MRVSRKVWFLENAVDAKVESVVEGSREDRTIVVGGSESRKQFRELDWPAMWGLMTKPMDREQARLHYRVRASQQLTPPKKYESDRGMPSFCADSPSTSSSMVEFDN